MRLLVLLALAAAVPASAQTASTEPYSIARAGLSREAVGLMLDACAGRCVAVGDRFVNVSTGAEAAFDVPLTVPEGEELARRAVSARVERLRASAREGMLTEQDRAEARALALARGIAFGARDLYFLASLNPDVDLDAQAPDDGPAPVAAPPAALPAPDPLLARLRSKLVLNDHGDPIQAEALDMAVRRMMTSPTARELAAEFVALNKTVGVSFEAIDGSTVYGDAKHRGVSGIGGLTIHEGGTRVVINVGYLQTDLRTQFESIPGTLAHELLGHALNGARAANAGVTAAMNVWRGDEDLAAMTGWAVQADITGRAPADPYLWQYLQDPERYHRALHLVTKYYAQTFSQDEAARAEDVYRERLGRVEKELAYMRDRYDSAADWRAALVHFETVHGVASGRLAGVSVDVLYGSTESVRADRARLEEIRDALTSDLKELKDPVARSRQADAVRLLSDPFFADGERRLAKLTARVQAAASRGAPFQSFPPNPDAIGWTEFIKMYQDDRRDHPEHWAPAPQPPSSSGPSSASTSSSNNL